MILFTLRLGPVPSRITAEVASVDGKVEFRIVKIAPLGIPLGGILGLRPLANKLIAAKSPLPCRINERANLEFTLPLRVTRLTADLDLAASL